MAQMKRIGNRGRWTQGAIALMGLGVMGLAGCGESEAPKSALDLVVNGEAFAEMGMVSKDQWQMEFEQVIVTVGAVTASGVPSQAAILQPKSRSAALSWPLPSESDPEVKAAVVSLQDGPVRLGSQPVTVGNYNQVKWTWGSGETAAIALQGTATQGDRTVTFNLEFPGQFQVACGDYVGDERKGIVTADEAGEVELTFHLDHVFGDGEFPPEAEINQKSVGFGPLVEATEGDEVTVTAADWEQWGTPELRRSLEKTVQSMPHVGEGHCQVEEETAS